jgi:pimeloyl-ACP methyl ester carboxylesterase
MPDERTGRLKEIRHEGRERAVVFLHGFTGVRDDTWDRFPGLLGAHLQGWDIFTLGYATTLQPDVVGIWSADPDLPILATMLRTELAIPPLASYQSLALVAHSMGGLIVQRALADGEEVIRRVAHVILFGTPSAGLRKASWLRFWKRQFQNMARESEFIVSLRQAWETRFSPEPPFQLLVIAGASDQFVTPDSSLQPFDRRFHRVVPGNHLDIVKPADSGAASLRLVLSALSKDAQAPPDTASELTLAAERPSTNAERLVADYENQRTHKDPSQLSLSEREVVQAALALERAGKRSKAVELLERYQSLGTDVQGTLAGRMKRVWFETEDPHHAQRAFELYDHALQQASRHLQEATDAQRALAAREQIYYHAINVAFLEFVFHQRLERAREMAQLAAQHASEVPENVWSIATLAEARLYLGDNDGALQFYRKLISLGGEHPIRTQGVPAAWQFASAGLQAARVAAALDDPRLAEALDGIFTPGARQTNRIFVTYSHKDREWIERLQIMARPYLRQAEAELDLWVDTRISAGDTWRDEIAGALRHAGVAVALVSADFLASDFVWRYEMPEILRAAREEKLRLLWAYVSPAGWEETPLREFQAVHDTSKPIALMRRVEQDEVLKSIAREIKRAALSATERFVA